VPRCVVKSATNAVALTKRNKQHASWPGMTLKVTEFVTASELASMMSVPVTDIIKACFALGMMVSINQRLDAETLAVIAEEYGFKVEFVGADVQEDMQEEDDDGRARGSTCTDRHRHGSRRPRKDLLAGLHP
jgi:hypothetical protein